MTTSLKSGLVINRRQTEKIEIEVYVGLEVLVVDAGVVEDDEVDAVVVVPELEVANLQTNQKVKINQTKSSSIVPRSFFPTNRASQALNIILVFSPIVTKSHHY